MAKHSKKKVLFSFIDISEAQEFLELIGRKKLYANVTANMKTSGKLELTLIGSPDNIKRAQQKLKKLHNSVMQNDSANVPDPDEEEEELDVKFKLKKLKFEES